MASVIKTYKARLGEVTVTAYTENGSTEYRVKHTLEAIETYWTRERKEAIAHAQFIAAKY